MASPKHVDVTMLRHELDGYQRMLDAVLPLATEYAGAQAIVEILGQRQAAVLAEIEAYNPAPAPKKGKK